ILNSTVHHSGVFSIQMYTRKSAAFRNALKFNRPISQFLMCPDSGVRRERAFHAHRAMPNRRECAFDGVCNQYEDIRCQCPAAFIENKAYGATIRD
ncbi:hypothetical protein, partial [Methylocystis sp.]|uniref:hypothetical protein n=1 Tax=Methylocystis sp. TaxID=1911079 RepID=UPI0025CE2C07